MEEQEEEEKNQIQRQRECNPPETDLFLKWGNRKKLRCVRIKDPEISDQSNGSRFRRRVTTSQFATETFSLQPTRFARNSSENGNSPEKEDRYYTTRRSVVGLDENGKIGSVDGIGGDENIGTVWPKLYIALSSKEKEEDFMAMKGCKPPHRPKKRAKIIQRSLLLVSPGAWLSDLCQERYEVREKKSTKKRLRGLKALGSMDSGSE